MNNYRTIPQRALQIGLVKTPLLARLANGLKVVVKKTKIKQWALQQDHGDKSTVQDLI